MQRNKVRQLRENVDLFIYQCDTYMMDYYSLLDFYFKLISSKKELTYDF
jgi:hypothetical protein